MLTPDQVREAVAQMVSFCRDREDANNYELLSTRGLLNTLGYEGEDIETVLAYCFDRGFTYCLDPKFHKSPSNDIIRISMDVCHWGPDQLRSRLEWIR